MKSNYISKGIIMLLALAGSNYSYAQQATVVVNNPTDAQRQELVEVNISDVKAKLAGIAPKKGEAYIVKNKRGQQIGSQITHDGKLLIDASIRPHGSATYYISIGKPYPQKVWTTGALYKMRKDDIAWENDRCAYRVYGPALQRTGERSFGTDIWAKNTPDTVVYERYVMDKQGNVDGDKVDEKVKSEERKMKNLSGAALEAQKAKIKALKAESYEIDVTTSFHLDHGNGLDPYRVGATLGLGAPSLMIGNQQFLPYCYKTYKILDNGPLRFTVELTYNPSTIGDMQNVVEHRIISLDKGSNFNKMTVWYEGLTHPTDFATGFPIHEEDTETKTFAKDYVSYADPTDNIEVNNSQVFVGVLFPNGIDNTYYQLFDKKHDGATGHALGLKRGLKNAEKYSYYFGAAWSKYDVRSYTEWQIRIKEFLEALKTPLQVKL
ncbi:MAG: DUF4861 domain-containing protein [Prevotella sp.]|uniref:DUF4861 domain-containing protein n=1 Tax=Prevotella sp. TaxID=59823 RepID=UPI0025E8A800|nr:DUF4861 domain-containing protein [Prevotella sp.]MBD9298797.1 DUF4861 domain-containing protein [Prevotella sp.]